MSNRTPNPLAARGGVVKESIPVSITPNREYQSPNGMIYYFNITFANGDQGEFSTNKKAPTKFIEQEKVKYTVTEKTINTKKGPWKKVIIDRYKEPENRLYSNDPKDIERIVRAVSLECALRYRHLMTTHFDKPIPVAHLADKFVSIIGTAGQERSNSISAQVAMKKTIDAIEYTAVADRVVYVEFEKIISIFSMFYDYVQGGE